MSNFDPLVQSRISKFIKDKKFTETQNSVTVGEGNIFTNGESDIAFLPQSVFYNIKLGALLTANKKTRYALSKNNNDFSVKLNKVINWDNNGFGYSFSYQNPIKQLLDNSKNILGYITKDHQLYLIDDVPEVSINKLFATANSDGLKLLNNNKFGIYIDNDGNIYKGDDINNVWELLDSSSSYGVIDGGDFIWSTTVLWNINGGTF